MYTYSLISNSDCILRSDGACFRQIPENPEYVEYLSWVEQGNTPTPVGGTIPVVITLDQAKAVQRSLLNEGCQQEIYTGFISDTLGTSYRYPGKLADQLNLARTLRVANSVFSSPGWTAKGLHVVGDTIVADNQYFICTSPGISSANIQDWNIPIGTVTTDGSCSWKIWTTSLWCELGGIWERREHTVAQLLQVARDEDTLINSVLEKHTRLQAQVEAYQDVATVQSVVWT